VGLFSLKKEGVCFIVKVIYALEKPRRIAVI